MTSVAHGDLPPVMLKIKETREKSTMSTTDAPKKSRETDDVPVPATLRKSLKNRHIQLIALGGAIGTGLFYGSSESIALAGPSILLAYLIGGLAIFMIVRALSEMSVEDPKAGAFSYYATRTGPSAPASSPAGTTGSTTSSSRWWSCPWWANS